MKLTFWGNISIKIKILLLVGSVFFFLGIFLVFQMIELSYKEDAKNADDIIIAMLQARSDEKDFISQRDPEYVKKVDRSISTVDSIIEHYAEDKTGDQIKIASEEYRKKFQSIVDIINIRGLDEKSGLEGKLRESIHSLEALFNKINDKTIKIDMLMCRRHEKDFFLRLNEKYVKQLLDEVALLREHTENSSLPDDSKLQAMSYIDSYETDFINASKAILDLQNEIKSIHQIFLKFETLTNAFMSEKDNAASTATGMKWIVLFLAIVASLIVGYRIAKIISSSLKNLTKIADTLAAGEVHAIVDAKTTDEVGQLEASFQKMVKNIESQAEAAEKISRGDLSVDLKVKSDKDVIPLSLLRIAGTITQLTDELSGLTTSAVSGQLQKRGDYEKFNGSYREVVAGINNILDAIVQPINESGKVLAEMARGDLTIRMTGQYSGEFSKVKDSINGLADSLNSALSEIVEAVHATASASNQISSSTQEMATGAQEQSAQTAEIAGAVEEMTTTIVQTTKNSNSAAESAKNAGDIARKSGEVVEQTVKGMNRISDVVSKAALTVDALGKSSNEIGEIIQVIDDIADQTNLLALNAAIEAARAGEQGRGFSVVADEVRKLAERTTKATKEIATMIRTIQHDTNEAVKSMEEGTTEVEKGKNLANRAGESLNEIIGASDEVLEVISHVASASEEQSATAEQISKNIESINNITQESSAGVVQIARSTEDLNRLTENLQALISKFKITVSRKEEVVHRLM